MDTTEQKPDVPSISTEERKPDLSTTSYDEKRPFPHPDTPEPERPTFKPREDLSLTETSQTIPQSMQGFNKHELAPAPIDNRKKISPHKRVPPPTPYVPSSMQDIDVIQTEPKQEKTSRRKEKLHIRQTSEGWVEFDKEEEDELKKQKVEEEMQLEEAQTEDIAPEENVNMRESKEPEASTQASWQAFAASAPSGGFEVSFKRLKVIPY